MNTIYDMVEIHSEILVVPEMYQRRLNKNRVARIVATFDERIANEPKVSFRDGKYYLMDGQHTITARKQMNGGNDLPILCKVYHGMTEDEESLLFAAQTGGHSLRAQSSERSSTAKTQIRSRSSKPPKKLHIGFERAEGDGRITCINTALSEFKRVGAEVYTEALTVINKAWNGKSTHFEPI